MANEEANQQVVTVEGYASTDLINKLLGKLDTEAKTYKRNKKASEAAHSQSHVVYKELVGLVKVIEEFAKTDEIPHWDTYEKSHTGITGLERYLLDLLFEGHNEEAALLATSTVQEYLQFVLTWQAHYKVVVTNAKALDTLVFDEAKVLEDGKRAEFKNGLLKGQREDHASTVDTINQEVTKSPFADTDIRSKPETDTANYVADVKTAVASLSTKMSDIPATFDFPESEAVGVVVAGVMLLHVPFLITQLDTTDAKTDEYFKSLEVWKPAKKFAEYLLAFLDTDQKDRVTLDKEYADFKAVLEGTMALGPWIPQILSMMRLSANVRRPFYGRSVALVKIWYSMNKKSDSMKEENRNTERKNLRAAFEATIKAIDKAKTDIKTFEVDVDAKITEVETSYAEVYTTVQTMIDLYASGEKETLMDVYTKAETTDKEHLKDFRAKQSFLKAAT